MIHLWHRRNGLPIEGAVMQISVHLGGDVKVSAEVHSPLQMTTVRIQQKDSAATLFFRSLDQAREFAAALFAEVMQEKHDAAAYGD